jgi:hypothetical protein
LRSGPDGLEPADFINRRIAKSPGERVFTQNSRQIHGVGSAPSVSLPPVHAVWRTRLRRNAISRIIKDASRPHTQTDIAQTEPMRGHVIITADRHTAWRQHLFAFSDAIRAEHERVRQRRSRPVSAKECSVRRMARRSRIESCDFFNPTPRPRADSSRVSG